MVKKSTDRHVEPKRVSFTFPIDESDLARIQIFGQDNDRTKASILREAVRDWIRKLGKRDA